MLFDSLCSLYRYIMYFNVSSVNLKEKKIFKNSTNIIFMLPIYKTVGLSSCWTHNRAAGLAY